MSVRPAIAVVLGGLACLLQGAPARGQAAKALTPADIDHQIRLEWKQQGVIPSSPVDDARFLRRVYLDLTGSIPTADEVKAFLSDRTPDKRQRTVSSLLSSSKYADHWANYWDSVLMGTQIRSQLVDRSAFREWLHSEFAQNTPYDRFVYDLLTARGQNSTGGSYAKALGMPAGAAMMAQDGMNQAPTSDSGVPVNGAVNWTLKYAGNPQDLAGSASKLFLGVQIQCAQCHDHKTEKWKQTDFRSFTACFVNTRPIPVDRGMVKGIRRVDVIDTRRPFVGGPKVAKDNLAYATAAPEALDHTDFSDSANRRQALASWIIAPQNQWFAQEIVNRMWGHFLGRGFVDPIDDLRPSNPAVAPELFKLLTDDFVANHYDLKHLIQLICSTQVYQLSSSAAKKADPENKYWARCRLKSMGPDELMDALMTATQLEPVLTRVAGRNLEQLKFQLLRQFTFLFDVDEEFEQKDFEGTIPQALMLLNGAVVNRGVSGIPGTTEAQVMAMGGGDADKISALYLCTLSRMPTQAEVAQWTNYVNAPRDVILQDADPQAPQPVVYPGRFGARRRPMRPLVGRRAPGDPLARVASGTANSQSAKQQAYEDLFWALLNSSEFIFNH